jgi:PAS domain S-box-containing protein
MAGDSTIAPATPAPVGQGVADVLEGISDAFFALDHQWRFSYLNSAAERLLLRPRAELLGRSVWNEFPQAVGSTFDREYHRAIAHGVTAQFVEFYPPLETWFEVRAYPTPSGLSVYFQAVNERVQAEQARRELLQKIEQQARVFHTTLSSITDFAYTFDRAGRFLYANRALLDLWGLTLDQAVGKNFFDLKYPEELAAKLHRQIEGVFQSGRPVRDETPYTSPSGLPGSFEYIFSPVFAEDGSVSAVAGSTREISGQKRAQEELRAAKDAAEASLAQWHAAFSSMSEGLIIADPQGNLIDWNRAALSMHGFASVTDVRKHLHAFVEIFQLSVLDGRALAIEEWPMARVLRGERFSGYEVRVRRLDKPMDLIVSYSGTPVRDRDGALVLGMLTLHDVTEERRAQTELRHTAERLSLAMAAADLGDWYWDPASDILTMSARAADIFGVPPGPTMTRDAMRNLIHPDDRERARELAIRSVADRGDYEIEYRVVRADGKALWVAAKGRGQYDGDGKLIGMLGVVQDVTQRKSAEQELERLLVSERAARSDAERNSRMKDEFLATLSHELRTPLNAILGWSQVLRSTPPDAADLSQGLDTIERNARAQTQIISDLLDMSRIISGKVRLDVQRIDLRSVVEAAIDTVRHAADAKGVRLHTVLDPVAGPVSGDAGRLQQVFWNLVSNAIKFTPRGGRVQVLLERVNSNVEVSVIDTGEGIKPEFLPLVFDRFRQADSSTTRRHGGLGLGLSICKQLVELHGGMIYAKSPGLEHGSTFTVVLPLTVLHAPREPEEVRRHPQSRPDPRAIPADACVKLNGLKILVIDDEPDARALVQRLLEDCEARVFVAASAAEALPMLSRERPDVLISDIGMPGEDGYELIRKVRALGTEAGGDLPAVALTAYARSEDRTKAMLSGYQTHISKPVEPSELIATVASLAGRTGRP